MLFHDLLGYQAHGALFAIGIGTAIYIPVDKYVDSKFGKLDKLDVNKPNIILTLQRHLQDKVNDFKKLWI
ncbi:MAG: hypothetical protein GY749_03625 [Desulfobacteraceae bacterium]|nr:hypothetical protein [Desulfobacteraceae bacterium]